MHSHSIFNPVVVALLALGFSPSSHATPRQPPPPRAKSQVPLSSLPSCNQTGNLPGKGCVRTCMNEIAILSCPQLSVITTITSTFYGNLPKSDPSCKNGSIQQCQASNLTESLSKRVVGLNNATLVVRGEILIGGQGGWLPDPCPGVGKSFNVTWCCGNPRPPPPPSSPVNLDSPPPLYFFDQPPGPSNHWLTIGK